MLAGAAVALAAQQIPRASQASEASTAPPPRFVARLAAPFTLLCAGLAAAPDLDLLLPNWHREGTHSLTAVALVFIIAAGVTGWVTGRVAWRTALVCAAAYATHLLLDWLGTDNRNPPFGLQILWPWRADWYISGLNLFLGTERLHPFSPEWIARNTKALLMELALLGPIVTAAWLLRVRPRRARDARALGDERVY